jgi:hypothetical protein
MAPILGGLGLVNEAFGYRSHRAPAGYKLMQDRFCSCDAKARLVAKITRVTASLGAAARQPRLADHRPFACSGVKVLRTQAAPGRQAAKLRWRFGPLTACARCADQFAGDGTKNGSPAPKKNRNPNRSNNRRIGDPSTPANVTVTNDK